MILWPHVLPQYIQASGYSEQLANTMHRTQMDAGPAKARRRFTAAPRPLTGDIVVTAAQLTFFRYWYDNVLLGGTLRFGWVEPGSTTLLTNLITNGGFDSATTGWGAGNCTIASVAGGISGYCLELTADDDPAHLTEQYAIQAISLTTAHQYSLSGYVKSGTSGNEAFQLYLNEAGVAIRQTISGTSSSDWAHNALDFTVTDTIDQISLTKGSATHGTMLFDEVSLVDITTGISEMRFTEPPVITAHGVEYRISMKLEILP